MPKPASRPTQPTCSLLTEVITTDSELAYSLVGDRRMKRLMVFVPLESAHKKSGSVALIAAMLDRAVEDVRAGDRLRTDALAWVCDLDAKDRLGSFEWCCVALNLDVDAVRTRIVRQQSAH